MAELDLESDSFLSLLTDALRAGPGSPAWHQALQQLRAGGIEHADEYQLLVSARQHLESGKSYRSIRAGTGFTQRLMTEIDGHGIPAQRTPPTTTMIALTCAAAMLVVLLVVGYLLWTAADTSTSAPDGSALLVNTVALADFSGPLGADWQIVGRLGIELGHGSMRYAPSSQPADATGGGVIWTQSLAPDKPFAIVAGLRAHHLEDNLVAQVFVTDDPQFSPDNATSPHELVWLVQGNQVQVILPSGRVEAQVDLPQNYRGPLTPQITIDRDQATVELGNRRLWAGPHGLDPARPRYVGARFLRRAGKVDGGVVFQWIRVNTRQN